jgi:hypothetical protein
VRRRIHALVCGLCPLCLHLSVLCWRARALFCVPAHASHTGEREHSRAGSAARRGASKCEQHLADARACACCRHGTWFMCLYYCLYNCPDMCLRLSPTWHLVLVLFTWCLCRAIKVGDAGEGRSSSRRPREGGAVGSVVDPRGGRWASGHRQRGHSNR